LPVSPFLAVHRGLIFMVKSGISIELYCTLGGYRVVAWSNGKVVFARTYALRQVALKACKRLERSLADSSKGKNTSRSN
jgi:hypothetical protein